MHDNSDDRTHTHVVLTKGTMVNHYRIVEKIGAGGMGEVYLAEDTKLDRRVALKFMPPHLATDADARTRFTREAQAAAKLDHPNIVTIHDVGEYRNRPYFAMQMVKGQLLHHYCHEEPLSIETILQVASQTAEGLASAHANDIIHRDIKTSNIIIDGDMRPRILDFGIAALPGVEALTKTGTTVGTVAYMSPEQARGEQVDQRSDLFSLGVVLYELIAGRTPFRRDTEAATLKAIVDDNPQPLARYRNEVTDGIQRIVSKLLQKDPGSRYQTAVDLAADLKTELRLHQGGPTSSSAPTIPEPRGRVSSGIKKLTISSTSLVIVLVLLMVLKPWKIDVQPTDNAAASENRLAIVYFDNLADPADSTRLGEMIANLLITDLSESSYLRVVSSQRLYDILKQLGQEETHAIDRETATRISQLAGARWMLTGTILQVEPDVVVTTQIIEVGSGQVEASQRSVRAADENIFAQIDKLATEIRNDLAIPGLSTDTLDPTLSEVTTNSPEAYRYYLEGVEQLRKLYSEEAQESFRKAIEVDSTFAMAYFQLGARFNDKDQLRMAVKYSNHASRHERMRILAVSDQLAGDVDGAIAAFEQIIEEYPDDKVAYTELAEIYLEDKNQPDEAIRLLEKARDIDPYDKTIYNQLAYFYKSQREYDKAIGLLDRYLEIAPDEPNPYDSRGEIFAAAGQLDSAVASYRKALAIDPGFDGSLAALTIVYTMKGEYAKADSCARALARSENPIVRSTGRLSLVLSAAYRGQAARALDVLDKGIATDSLEGIRGLLLAFKFFAKGVMKYYQEDLEGAIGEYLEARRILLESEPNAPLPFADEYAATLALTGEADRALNLLEDARPQVEQEGHYNRLSLLYYGFGRVEFNGHNYDKAKEYFTRVTTLPRGNHRPNAEYYIAVIHIRDGQPEKAIPLLKRLTNRIESRSNWHPVLAVLAHYQMGIAYEGSGDIGKAVKSFETFLDIWKESGLGKTYIQDARERLARLRG